MMDSDEGSLQSDSNTIDTEEGRIWFKIVFVGRRAVKSMCQPNDGLRKCKRETLSSSLSHWMKIARLK